MSKITRASITELYPKCCCYYRPGATCCAVPGVDLAAVAVGAGVAAGAAAGGFPGRDQTKSR